MLILNLSAVAGEIKVAVAANFSAPMEKIAEAFHKKTGHHVLISSGATGKLYSQIKNGAPFEVFLSADQATVTKLVQDKLACSELRFVYAIGKLVLWSRNAKLVDSEGKVLSSITYKHLSIANPELSPYGMAAKEVLSKINLWEKKQSVLVLGESIAQSYQFVASGNAELGFVSLSQIKNGQKQPEGSFWLIPGSMYSELKQDAVVLEKGKTNKVAIEILDFIKSDEARKAIQESGYDVSFK